MERRGEVMVDMIFYLEGVVNELGWVPECIIRYSPVENYIVIYLALGFAYGRPKRLQNRCRAVGKPHKPLHNRCTTVVHMGPFNEKYKINLSY